MSTPPARSASSASSRTSARRAFPSCIARSTVYAKLADAEGEYGIRLELIRLDDSHVVAQGTLRAGFADRMTPGELTVNLENLGVRAARALRVPPVRRRPLRRRQVLHGRPVGTGARPQLMRVLILTASYGSGHNDAAHSLAAAFADARRHRDGRRPLPRAGAPALRARQPRASTWPCCAGRRSLWGAAYALGDSAAERLAAGLRHDPARHRRGWPRCSTRWRPTPSSSVHATPAAAMSALAAEGRRRAAAHHRRDRLRRPQPVDRARHRPLLRGRRRGRPRVRRARHPARARGRHRRAGAPGVRRADRRRGGAPGRWDRPRPCPSCWPWPARTAAVGRLPDVVRAAPPAPAGPGRGRRRPRRRAGRAP